MCCSFLALTVIRIHRSRKVCTLLIDQSLIEFRKWHGKGGGEFPSKVNQQRNRTRLSQHSCPSLWSVFSTFLINCDDSNALSFFVNIIPLEIICLSSWTRTCRKEQNFVQWMKERISASLMKDISVCLSDCLFASFHVVIQETRHLSISSRQWKWTKWSSNTRSDKENILRWSMTNVSHSTRFAPFVSQLCSSRRTSQLVLQLSKKKNNHRRLINSDL